MSKFEKKKRNAIIVVLIATLDSVLATIAAWVGSWRPWTDRINWDAIPNWYYVMTIVLMIVVGIYGSFWIRAQEE